MFWNLTEHSLFEMSYATFLWIRNFFFADSASVHTYPVNPAYESGTFFKPALQSGNFWIRYESGIVWTVTEVTRISVQPLYFINHTPTVLYNQKYKEYEITKNVEISTK